jgi:molecular chaperone GrpE (heat shock protein)
LASIQRDVALLEKSLGALQEAEGPALEREHAFARGLIQRIDLLEDLMAAGEKSLPGMAARLAPLHASLLELLKEQAIEPFTVPPGQALDVATRKRITIVEPAPEGEGLTQIAEVFRSGYHFTRGSGDLPAVILRKAEVRTMRLPLGQAP